MVYGEVDKMINWFIIKLGVSAKLIIRGFKK